MRATSSARAALVFFLTMLPALSRGAESSQGFVIARLKYSGGGDWYNGPTEMPNLERALRERTTVAVDRLDEPSVSIMDPEFFSYPFIFMDGHGNVSFSDSEVERLRRYLLAGGFLFANDDYGMDASFRREMQKVFPDRRFVEVPYSNPIYHCFYDLPAGPPKIHEHDGKPPQGFGIFDGNRLMVYYDYEADIADGLDDPDVHHDPQDKRDEAMKMAVNIVVYALSR